MKAKTIFTAVLGVLLAGQFALAGGSNPTSCQLNKSNVGLFDRTPKSVAKTVKKPKGQKGQAEDT